MSLETLKNNLRTVPDFPIKGILFFDITTLLKDPGCLKELSDRLYELYKDKGITKVVGLESRGFVMGADLAVRLGAGFVMARKRGKLPADTIEETYQKEYGYDTIEIHRDAIQPGDVVLIHDDLLATGGTAAAALRLVQKFGPARTYLNFLINITDCPRLKEFPQDAEITSIIDVEEHA